MKPKEEFYDAVIDIKDGVTLEEASKALNFKNMGQNNLFKYLRRSYMLTHKNKPMQHVIDKGLFDFKLTWIETVTGPKMTGKSYVTPKGIEYLRNMLKKSGYKENK